MIELFSLKGWDMTAQGNALGFEREDSPKP